MKNVKFEDNLINIGNMNAISLLRYAGGKTRAVKKLLELIPCDVNVASPFVGGASVEIALSNRGQKVKCYDSYEPLIAFWQSVSSNPYLLHEKINLEAPDLNVSKEAFKIYQKKCNDLSGDIDVYFFILNRCSFSGTTNSGGMSIGHPRFNKSCVDKILKFKSDNIDFELSDFKSSIRDNHDSFLFLDPPYDISCFLYGNKGSTHRGFDHKGLSELLLSRGNWLMTYNDNEYIRSLYKGCKIRAISWAYGMNSSKKSNEIVIMPN
jgi:DNA adenine methylase